ncbi:MAG: hypothetical protein RL748_2558 [Pseudomonadota bacterium]|jgi:toxin-antitoxin system PIN domain toxin
MRYLLDVNVLIALIDPGNVHHNAAHGWFAQVGKLGFATCPLTQNGVLRIVGSPRYPNSPGSPASVVPIISGILALAGHEFWPDDVSLLDETKILLPHLIHSAQVTDSYLLALAVAHGGKLASFDRRMATKAVVGGAQALELIE